MHSYLIISSDKKLIEKKIEELVPFSTQTNSPDFNSIQTEGAVGIDEVRKIKSFLSVKPFSESHKVVAIYDAHRLTIPAQNALLKTLEEPPDNSILILAATNEAGLLPTIISRCEVVNLAFTDTKIDVETGEALKDLMSSLSDASLGRKVSLAGEYAYPKDKGKRLCTDLINYFRSNLRENPNKELLENLKLAQQSMLRLEQNVDPRLTLEHLFLNLQ